MYIIVSTTYKYIGDIIGHDCIYRATTIGHEIHITRPILIFLLCQHLISTDDIIVTKNNERFFLYSDIFKNIIEYDNLPTNLQIDEVADITHINSLLENKNDLNFKIDIEEKFPILKKMRNNEIPIKTEIYNHFMAKINYIDLGNIENDYIVIHDRHTSYSHHPSDVNSIQYLVNSILNNFPHLNIIIFSILLDVENKEKIKIIRRIDEYASYMNNDKCKAVISPFSGGGQLAQYCHNKFIFYYQSVYPFYPGYNIDDVFQKGNEDTNMYSYFDLKKITDTTVFVVDDYVKIIEYLHITL